MGAADKAAILRFAYSLPQEDLLFLRSDITDPAHAEEHAANLQGVVRRSSPARINRSKT